MLRQMFAYVFVGLWNLVGMVLVLGEVQGVSSLWLVVSVNDLVALLRYMLKWMLLCVS